jgi:hypothetical protein
MPRKIPGAVKLTMSFHIRGNTLAKFMRISCSTERDRLVIGLLSS